METPGRRFSPETLPVTQPFERHNLLQVFGPPCGGPPSPPLGSQGLETSKVPFWLPQRFRRAKTHVRNNPWPFSDFSFGWSSLELLPFWATRAPSKCLAFKGKPRGHQPSLSRAVLKCPAGSLTFRCLNGSPTTKPLKRSKSFRNHMAGHHRKMASPGYGSKPKSYSQPRKSAQWVVPKMGSQKRC